MYHRGGLDVDFREDECEAKVRAINTIMTRGSQDRERCSDVLNCAKVGDWCMLDTADD